MGTRKLAYRDHLPAALLFVACLVYALAAANVGWTHGLLDAHGFRQTQTAISTYYMIGRGPSLSYETPVLGPPWSVPFEFPLYQWLVAAAVSVLGTPLEPTGRFFSFGIFLLTLVPAYRVLGFLQVAARNRLVPLSLLLVSPLYLFWSRTFLIESTAVCLGMSYLAFALSCADSPRRWPLVLAALFGSLAALVKITTFAPFLLSVLLVLLHRQLRQQRLTGLWSVTARHAWVGFFCVCLPVALGMWWTRFADGTKALNPFGRDLTSSSLWFWNFGHLEQRWSAETWRALLHQADCAVGNRWVAAGCLLGLGVARRRREVLACAALCLSAPLVFTNLHYVHEYYAYANGLFLVAAVGIGLVAMMERGGWSKGCALAGLAVVMGVCVARYHAYYYPKQRENNKYLAHMGKVIRGLTGPDELLVIVGCDWSPEIPYYSERRALMVPKWRPAGVADVRRYLETLEGHRLGAFVLFEPATPHLGEDVVRGLAAERGLAVAARHSYGPFAIYPLARSEVAVSRGPTSLDGQER